MREAVFVVGVLGLVGLAACEPPGYGKDKPDAAIDGTTGDGLAIDAAHDAAVALCSHGFRLDGHVTASSVWLTGDFATWAATPQAGATELTLGSDGGWTGSKPFQQGTYQYKFIVDGNQWIADPTNPNQIDDGNGGHNSVYVCQP